MKQPKMTRRENSDQLEVYLTMARALLQSMDSVVSSMPEAGNPWHFVSYKAYASRYTSLVQAISAIESLPEGILFPYDLDTIRGIGDTIAIQQQSMFRQVHGDLSMLCSWLELAIGTTSSSSKVRNLEDFLSSKLRPAMLRGNPESEKEVQNTIEKILIGRGMQRGVDYDRETGRIKHSGKESIPDFVFRPLSVALEVKFSKNPSNVGRIVDEINADVLAYKKGYEHIIFVVYDNGTIDDVDEFRYDIEISGNTRVLVIKN